MRIHRRLSKSALTTILGTRIVGIRAGVRPHRFIGVWAVVVNGRVFVRSWNDSPHGWHQAFRKEPRGTLQIPERQIRVHARRARGERLMDAIGLAYAEKYATPGSRKYVRGFAQARRRATTIELTPR